MPDDKIVYDKQGNAVSFVGKDAVSVIANAALASSLRLYATSGIRPSRAVTPKLMLERATQVTGKKYKRGAYMEAADDVSKWVQEMKSALPQETV